MTCRPFVASICLLACVPDVRAQDAAGRWTGTLVRVAVDDFGRGTGNEKWVLWTGDREFDVSGWRLEARQSGKRVRVSGAVAGARIRISALAELEADSPVPACSPIGQQRIAVLMVTSPSHRTFIPAFTAASLQQAFFGSAGDTSNTASLNGLWKEMSYGLASASGQVFGPFALSKDYTITTDFQMLDEVVQVAGATVDFRQFNRIVLVFPIGSDAEWGASGNSTIGCLTIATATQGDLTASISWLPAFPVPPGYVAVPIPLYAHELGHGLGLGHASSDDYGAITLGARTKVGTTKEYGDPFSLMGSGYGQYSAPHKAQRLHWLSSGDYAEVSTPGSFTLAPYEANSGLRALRVLRDPVSGAWLWIEFRQPLGDIDKNLGSATTNVFSGALVHYEDPNLDAASHTYLLDFTPAATPNNFQDAALVAGTTWRDPDSPLVLTVNSASAQGLSISVGYSQLLQTITFGPVAGVVVGTPAFTLSATASSGLAVIFNSTTPSICSVAGNRVTPLAVGVCSITATQPGNSGYAPATLVVQSFLVAASGVSTFSIYSNLGTGDKVYDGSSQYTFINSATGGFSGVGYSAAATPFVPQFSGYLSEIDIAVGVVAGTGSMTVNLMSDRSGPGDILQSLQVSGGLPVGLGCCRLQKLLNAGSMQLISGTKYWMAVLPGANTWGWWAPNFAGTTGMLARNTGSGWNTKFFGSLNAFAVLGTTNPPPSINAGGVVPASGTTPTISPGEWVAIYGKNLADQTQQWKGEFPTSLGRVTVAVNGKAAYLSYVSPTQINFQAPDDGNFGPASVVVTSGTGTASTTVGLAAVAPSILLLDSSHPAGIILRGDGSGAFGGGSYDVIGPTGTSLGYATVAARAGDVIELFATGLGPTNPVVTAGQAFGGAAPVTGSVSLKINGREVVPGFAGLSGAGLYQINVTVPAGLGTGDVPLQLVVNGAAAQSGVLISLR